MEALQQNARKAAEAAFHPWLQAWWTPAKALRCAYSE
jgi:hypothetical protein